MHTLIARRLFVVLLCAVVLLAPTMVSARDCRPQIREGWVRMPPGRMPMMAGFGRIVNPCPMPAKIVSARSPSFGSIELHETRLVDGISRMRPVPELRLAPDGSAVLKPGGMHLMLMRPSAELKPGSRIVVEFVLADGASVFGEFEVRKPMP
jgi:copper(I)-binding protein